MEKYIMAYGFADKRLKQLQTLAEENEIGIRLVSDQDLDHQVESLLPQDGDIPNTELSSAAYEMDLEHILFVNFAQEELMSFIDVMNGNHLNVAHKAALTDNNRKWYYRDLIEANRKEHLMIKLYHSSQNVLKFAVDYYKQNEDKLLLEYMDDLQAVLVRFKEGNNTDSEEDLLLEDLRDNYNKLAQRLNQLMAEDKE